MIDRIQNHAHLEASPVDMSPYEDMAQFQAAVQLSEYFCHTYQIEISDNELFQLFITISNNTTTIDHSALNFDELRQFVPEEYITITEQILEKTEKTYYLEPFDNEFKIRFMIHINNLFHRVHSNYYSRNPLTAKIKATYPLIYDIAVYIAQEFEKAYSFHLTEDEIAYFALHIGGYFENSFQKKNKISCIFIYIDYYDGYKKTLEKISERFSEHLNIIEIVSLTQYQQKPQGAELIISMENTGFSSRYVVINPILTDADMDTIRVTIQEILKKKQNLALKSYLSDFLVPDLFYKNPGFSDKTEAITVMTKKAIAYGLAQESLTANVLQRESLSDTAFDAIAVPHSLHEDVDRSFISFAISDTPMKWGEKRIYIIVLIGVNQHSRQTFTRVFDFLIDVLSETQNVRELASSSGYEEFFQKLSLQLEDS